MEYVFDINSRAFNAIKNKTKRIEIRATKIGEGHFNYGILKPKDIIFFIAKNEERIKCMVEEVNWYESIEKLLMLEGTRYTLSSTNDYLEGIESINSLDGYKKAIKKNGIYAIHIKYIK